MKLRRKLSLLRIQWLIWVLLLGIYVLSMMQFDPFGQSVVYSLLSVGSIAAVLYGNAALLLPRLYEKKRILLYVLSVIALLAAVTFGKFWISYVVYNRFFTQKPVPIRWSGLGGAALSAIFAYLSSILFYIALGYFRLKQQQEQLEKRTAQAELNLLKAQVQPHFLFNTLNNIYFVAQRESPATAAMVEQLSQIMRYFVDEAPKERISLQSELRFIKSYIELEKMRMRFPLVVDVRTEGILDEIHIPPMLLIPLIENVFKHGVNKRKDDNFISAVIRLSEKRLHVTVTNRLPSGEEEKTSGGLGLQNLESRLELLFRDDFTLQYGPSGTIFTACLSIPA
jgi:hypothetical protein